MAQSQRSSRGRKIEPLNWQDAAAAPALKGTVGTVALLEVSPEEVRSGRFRGLTVVEPLPSAESNPDLAPAGAEATPGDESTPGNEAGSKRGRTPAEHRVPPEPVNNRTLTAVRNFPTEGNVITPGDETTPAYLTPGRGRSKVRRCVLAQDAHSLGEEAIYQALWRGGRAESADPNSSRTVKVGAAELGIKVNMAKKNVRQNIGRLFDKLAIEVLENFETISSQARTYRVFSYKQILERRRAHGLEYVLRNKGVAFCSPDGRQLLASPAYVSSPGDVAIRPAPPKKRRSAARLLPQLEAAAALQQPEVNGPLPKQEEIAMIASAFNNFVSADEGAAAQLIRGCRAVRVDATASEIEFFLCEKLTSVRNDRRITNPVGLVLTTVPQSFSGSTFETFRQRRIAQAAHAQEEDARRQREEEETQAWFERERMRLESIANDEGRAYQDRENAAVQLRRYTF